MRKLLIITILATISISSAFALPKNEKYSYKDFMHQKFTEVDPEEFNNTEIIGSCFYQESPWHEDALSDTPPDPRVDVFPAEMTGVIFKKCNLDNVKIPAGNTVDKTCTHKRIRVQNTLDDWVLDTDNKPLEPLGKDDYIAANVSIDPKDIPKKKYTRAEREAFENLLYPTDVNP